jgi:WD40 repeat protein
MRRWWPFAAALIAMAAAAPARADIFLTFDHSFPPSQLETRNAATGASVPLPPGVNQGDANQRHPSFSPDGRFLVFSRRSFQGAIRIVMVDRKTGQAADLFTAFDAALEQPVTPVFSLDGTKVITGRRLERVDPTSPPNTFQNSFTVTDVANFPVGPFPHQVVLAGGSLLPATPGRTIEPVAFGAGLLAFGIEFAAGGPPGRIDVQGTRNGGTLAASTLRFSNPAVAPSLNVVVFEQAPAAIPFETKLVFEPLSGFPTATRTALPLIVNANGVNVSNPTFSRDGRYLAFGRRTTQGALSRLFVWDTQTQLLVNPNGVGAVPSVTDGGIALEIRRVFSSNTVLSTGGLGGFTLSQGSSVGLLVQRIVGRHDVLGHIAPKLAVAGKVPLGSFRSGRHTVRWHFTVNGRRLPRGCYLVTFRALTRAAQVRDLSTPFTVALRGADAPRVSRGVSFGPCRPSSTTSRRTSSTPTRAPSRA